MYKTLHGLVLREVKYKESSKILTILTEEEGKITAEAKGVLRKGSRSAASAQALAWSELTVSEYRGRYTLTEGSVTEDFSALRSDLADYALGCYFAELAEAVSDEDSPNSALLRLTLNALFALSRRLYDSKHIKAAFEPVCGREDPEQPVLSLYGGTVLCAGCVPQGAGKTVPLGPAGLSAMRHVTEAEAKRIFSFSLDGDAAPRFEEACERYALAQLDRGFRTLDYWKSVSAFPYNG